MGVIGYEIAKRKKDGPNAEPIIMLRKKQEGTLVEDIFPGRTFKVKEGASIETSLEQLMH